MKKQTVVEIKWSAEAADNLAAVLDRVADFSGAQSAIKYLDEFDRLLGIAADNPHMGKPGLIPNTRELFPIHGKYRIVYETQNDTLLVLSVKSTRQLHD